MAETSSKGILAVAVGGAILAAFAFMGGGAKASETCKIDPALQAAVDAAMKDPSTTAIQLSALADQVALVAGCGALASKIRAEAKKRGSVIATPCSIDSLPEPLRSNVAAAMADPSVTADQLDALADAVSKVPGCGNVATQIKTEADHRRVTPTSTIKKVMIGSGESPVSITNKYGMSMDDFASLNPQLTFGVTNSNAPFNAPESDGVVSYNPVGTVDPLWNTPVWRRSQPQPGSGFLYFTKSGGVVVPTSNAGQGVGRIFSTGDGHVRFVRPWAAGQTVSVRISSGATV